MNQKMHTNSHVYLRKFGLIIWWNLSLKYLFAYGHGVDMGNKYL